MDSTPPAQSARPIAKPNLDRQTILIFARKMDRIAAAQAPGIQSIFLAKINMVWRSRFGLVIGLAEWAGGSRSGLVIEWIPFPGPIRQTNCQTKSGSPGPLRQTNFQTKFGSQNHINYCSNYGFDSPSLGRRNRIHNLSSN